MRRSGLLLALLTLALLLGLAFRERPLALPEVRREAAAGQFDTPRAIARLRRVLGDERPHSVDTAAGDAVRARILAELRALGLSPRVTDDFACNGAAAVRSVGCARVRNIVATIGPPGPGHLLLVSHYDSTPVGPGAADDGIGVAVMLEVAAQLARRDLRRPVSFLFNEGEESGLIGARAFLNRDPLARDVTRLLNLEARGVEGPAIMFETSGPNAEAVRWFARSAPRPVANSLATDFYKLIPNSTDVRVFEERPFTILNFAIIGNETRYHSPGDTVAALSGRSVQHMGDQALALANAHADGRPASGPAGARIFADMWARQLVAFPESAGLVGLALLILAFLYLAFQARKKLGRAAGAVLAAVAGSGALTYAGHVAVGALRPGEYWRGFPDAIGVAVLLSTAFASAAAVLWFARGESRPLRAAFWLLFVLLGAAITSVAPGASIFFLLSPLVAAVGLALGGRAEPVLSATAALLLVALWAPLVALVEVLLDYDNAWVFAPLFSLMLLPALIELKVLAGAFRKRVLLASLALPALAAWAVAASLPAYSADRKQAFGIEYALDPDGEARWLVVNDGADLPAAFSRIGRFAGGHEVPWSTRKRWTAPAPAGLVRAPAVEVLGSRNGPGGRLVSVRLIANGAETITLLAPPNAKVLGVAAAGWRQKMGTTDDPEADVKATGLARHYAVRCQGRSCDGLRFQVLLARREPVTWTIIGNRSGLPSQARTLVAARPATAAPQYTADATIAVAQAQF